MEKVLNVRNCADLMLNKIVSGEDKKAIEEFAKKFLTPGSSAIKESIKSNANKIASDIVIGVKKGFED